jgi:hypothetical protein
MIVASVGGPGRGHGHSAEGERKRIIGSWEWAGQGDNGMCLMVTIAAVIVPVMAMITKSEF